MKNRRQFLLGFGGAGACGLQAQTRRLVIDAHCHAGLGQEMTAPWTTNGDIGITLRHMEEAGIDRSIIFPINNPTYEKANRRSPKCAAATRARLIGFAKHDPQTEAGRIPGMLRREVEQLGLKGLKLHKLPTRDVLEAVAELRIPVLYLSSPGSRRLLHDR